MLIDPEEVLKMTAKITVQQIVEHHLAQNTGQKLTPHLIMGLTAHIVQNLNQVGNFVPKPEAPVEEGAQQ